MSTKADLANGELFTAEQKTNKRAHLESGDVERDIHESTLPRDSLLRTLDSVIFRRTSRKNVGEQEPLPVPPFSADIPVSMPRQVPPPVDPRAALLACGIDLTEPPSIIKHGPTGPIWTVPVPEQGYPAGKLWEQVRAVHPQTGLWPVLADSQTLKDSGQSQLPIPGDGAAWLTANIDSTLAELPRGGIVTVEDNEGFDWLDGVNASLAGDGDRLLLVPAPAGWLVPGILDWLGAVNAGIEGNEHATVLRRWAGQWQAELVALHRDLLWLRILNPPQNIDGALTAAVEAVLYCHDSVTSRDEETLETLASSLTQPLWQFWWD